MSGRFKVAVLAALITLSGCGDGGPTDATGELGALVQAPMSETSLSEGAAQAMDRKLIQTGMMELEVDSLSATISALQEIAVASNGFVAGSEVREGDAGARAGSVTLRIPAAGFESARASVRRLGRVLSSSSESVDVTREYIDLETRVNVKTETVARLQDLLTRAGDLEDLLAVERELGRATTELESQKGQLQYMERQVSLSTLRIELFEPGAGSTKGVWKPVRDAVAGAGNVFAQSIGVIIFLVVLLFPWAVLVGLAWWIKLKVWKRSSA